MKKIISLFAALLSLPALKAETKELAIADETPKFIAQPVLIENKPEVKPQPRKSFDERLKDKVQHLREAEIDRKLKNGAKEFFYGENKVIARDKKNADRKARNLGYIC